MGEITPILMPKWGLSMKEGKLAVWHVSEGQAITPGDEIMDVETDKIANAVEAADGGLLRRRLGNEGETYPVRALLGVMAPDTVTDEEIEAFISAYETPAADDEDDENAAPAYQFVELSAGRIRYAERPGEAGETPVVLIHGFGGDLDNWLFNIDALAAAAPVYALDLPGHGQSVKDAKNASLASLSQTVIDFIDHIGAEKAHLVGHSMGGLIAASIAAENSARAASVTLLSPAGFGEEVNAGYIDGFVKAEGRRDLKPALELLFADKSLVSRSLIADLLKYKRIDGVSAFLDTLSAALFAGGRQTASIANALASAGVPAMVIWGAEDAIIPAAHAGALKGAVTHLIEGAGHMAQMEEAGKVNDLILDFIK